MRLNHDSSWHGELDVVSIRPLFGANGSKRFANKHTKRQPQGLQGFARQKKWDEVRTLRLSE
ncbi:MAG TPA: hypothetical protein VJU54_05700, partial [Nitrospiraceae bacterium]|nr:hypothetical protein [Nitrospiraceae bacterium]